MEQQHCGERNQADCVSEKVVRWFDVGGRNQGLPDLSWTPKTVNGYVTSFRRLGRIQCPTKPDMLSARCGIVQIETLASVAIGARAVRLFRCARTREHSGKGIGRTAHSRLDGNRSSPPVAEERRAVAEGFEPRQVAEAEAKVPGVVARGTRAWRRRKVIGRSWRYAWPPPCGRRCRPAAPSRCDSYRQGGPPCDGATGTRSSLRSLPGAMNSAPG